MAKKILIIEDEVTLLELMRSHLLHAGYEVQAAEDGEKGLELIYSWKPDLVLLDFLLPAKNGIEVLKSLKKAKNKTPVLVVSNSGNQLEVGEILKLGARDYLVKANFSPDEVLAKVEEILGIPPSSPKEKKVKEAEETLMPDGENIKKPDIVLIEDDRFLQELLKKKLAAEKWTVKTAYDGEEGLRLIRTLHPRLVLLDLLLPGMDGFELLSIVKQEPLVKDIPVLVLSNLGQREEINRAMELGAMDFLIKANFAPDEILKKVKPILEKK
ncbi:MAG TPA: response regulator [Candidatus Paceibacterota bacterium]